MIEELLREIAGWEQVEAIALGGSRAGEVYDEKSDYDVYLYCSAPVDEAVRYQLLERYCSYMEIGNHFWEQEDNVTLKNGIDMDILYRNLDDFAREVASVVEEYHPHNGYTTCMWHNLNTCKIIYDRDGRLEQVKSRFNVPYPQKLRENIIENNRRLLHTAMPAYELQIKKALGRGDMVSINHRTAAFMEAYFDIIFAINEQTHPGEKRLVQLCRKNCRILPEHFEENISRLFGDLFTNGEAVCGDLRAIIKELEVICPQKP